MKSSRVAVFSYIDNNVYFDQPNVHSFEPSVAPQQTGSNACASTLHDHVVINPVPMNEMALNENVSSGDCDMDQSVCSGGSDNTTRLQQLEPADKRQKGEQQKQQLTSVESPLVLDFEQVPPVSTKNVGNNENESRSRSPIVCTEKYDRPLLQPAILRPYDKCSGKALSSISILITVEMNKSVHLLKCLQKIYVKNNVFLVHCSVVIDVYNHYLFREPIRLLHVTKRKVQITVLLIIEIQVKTTARNQNKPIIIAQYYESPHTMNLKIAIQVKVDRAIHIAHSCHRRRCLCGFLCQMCKV